MAGKMSQKSLKQKIGYFWDYHKWKVILPVIILIFGISVITSFRKESRDLTLYIAMMNAQMDTAEEPQFIEDYGADENIDTGALPIRIETGLYHPKPDGGSIDEVTAAGIQKYRALLLNGYADVTITTEWVIDEYESANCYLNLQEVLPQQFYHSIEDKLYYVANENGDEVPVGIYVEKTRTMREYYEDEKPIVTISAFSKRTDNAVEFIMWLLEN